MDDGGCLNSDVSLGQQVLQKTNHVTWERGTRTVLVLCVLLACADLKLWYSCRQARRRIILTESTFLGYVRRESTYLSVQSEVWIFVLVYVDLCLKDNATHRSASSEFLFSLLLLSFHGGFSPYMSQWTVYSSVILAKCHWNLGFREVWEAVVPDWEKLSPGSQMPSAGRILVNEKCLLSCP